MPTYDYKCPECNHRIEVVHSIREEISVNCLKCKKAKLMKCPGAGTAVHFKGTGFYETDYKGNK